MSGGLTYSTAGESHGACLIAQIEGLPAGLRIPVELANEMLRLRQGGYGRSGRQKIERDEVDVLTGVIRGQTIGSPLAIRIANRDHRIDEAPPVRRPRPGHADLAGAYKWETADCRPVLE
ncbi:MAG: chorismate synthase, partial [bacterium]